jgi:hypothetical protein
MLCQQPPAKRASFATAVGAASTPFTTTVGATSTHSSICMQNIRAFICKKFVIANKMEGGAIVFAYARLARFIEPKGSNKNNKCNH